MQKFKILRQSLLWFWIASERKEKKITKNSGHLRLCQQPLAVHALRSDQLPKIVATFICASSHWQRTHSARTKMSCTFYHADRKCEVYLKNGYCNKMLCRGRHAKKYYFFERGYCFRGESCCVTGVRIIQQLRCISMNIANKIIAHCVLLTMTKRLQSDPSGRKTSNKQIGGSTLMDCVMRT